MLGRSLRAGTCQANGVTEEGHVEATTHLAFYAGWPNAVTAIGLAREVFGDQ